MTDYILIFDMPREAGSMQVKVNRKLKSLGAVRLQYSTWESKNFSGLKEVAKLVKQVGGTSMILEKKVVF